MDNDKSSENSALFLVRIWRQNDSSNASGMSWQGKVHHVLSHRAETFYDRLELLEVMAEMLTGSEDARRSKKPECSI